MADKEALQTELEELRAARHKLLVGKSVEQVSKGGDQSRRVNFTPANLKAIESRIRQIESELGINKDRRRRAIGVCY